jgi:two-component system CheB/CheR fusion protein
MIVFADVTALQKPVCRKSKTAKQTSTSRENRLEIDLQHTIGELQNIREEMQTSQEELKSTNEELQSTNEELQSTNEELLTSKEEMQSMNEELMTVNIELQSKIADFLAIDSDMKNLLNSTDIATLFLDNELNIRKYTDKVTNIFKLRPTDIGRPFTEMVFDLQYAEIANDAREVLKILLYKESDIPANDHRWFTVRIMPYHMLDDKNEGLVITFIDISAAKKKEAKLAAANMEVKGKLLTELVIANKELQFQNKEKQKRADELVIANKELNIQNREKENLKAELTKTINILREHNLYKP